MHKNQFLCRFRGKINSTKEIGFFSHQVAVASEFELHKISIRKRLLNINMICSRWGLSVRQNRRLSCLFLFVSLSICARACSNNWKSNRNRQRERKKRKKREPKQNWKKCCRYFCFASKLVFPIFFFVC